MSAPQQPLTRVGPVYLVDRMPGLHDRLITMLRSLKPSDWDRPTACALWSVKDITAHLLDTSLRRLSLGRDGLSAAPVPAPADYAELVAYLNRLNAEWTAACRRLSPQVLIELLEDAGPRLHDFLRSLDPHGSALFPVSWAGDERSPVWFDIGREYTEQWLHQQQIREAVGTDLLSGREWLHPTLDIFVRALPFTYREVAGQPGLSVRFAISGPAGGVWTLVRNARGWDLFVGQDREPSAQVQLDQETAWKLFSKGLSTQAARQHIHIEGDRRLGEPVFRSLAVMA
ncbi:MAG TPA: maleylpyruvate isomerase family mycothiol-dependent enzyme [Gemmatimonadales bacterium]